MTLELQEVVSDWGCIGAGDTRPHPTLKSQSPNHAKLKQNYTNLYKSQEKNTTKPHVKNSRNLKARLVRINKYSSPLKNLTINYFCVLSRTSKQDLKSIQELLSLGETWKTNRLAYASRSDSVKGIVVIDKHHEQVKTIPKPAHNHKHLKSGADPEPRGPSFRVLRGSTKEA